MPRSAAVCWPLQFALSVILLSGFLGSGGWARSTLASGFRQVELSSGYTVASQVQAC